MIQEDYISLEIAKLLKEKGFPVKEVQTWYCEFDGYPDKSIVTNKQYPQITLQMAMKWLREVHDLHIQVLPWRASEKETEKRWCCWVYKSYGMLGFEKYVNETLKSYEEACEAAIKYCLTNLI